MVKPSYRQDEIETLDARTHVVTIGGGGSATTAVISCAKAFVSGFVDIQAYYAKCAHRTAEHRMMRPEVDQAVKAVEIVLLRVWGRLETLNPEP